MQTIWDQFRADPRKPQNRQLLASDADREVLLSALSDARADGRLSGDEHEHRVKDVLAVRTLGELPAFVTDLYGPDAPASAGAVVKLDHAQLEALAHQTWQGAVRRSVTALVAVSLLSVLLWLIFTSGDFFWPLVVMALMGGNVGWVVARREAIMENRIGQLERRAAAGL